MAVLRAVGRIGAAEAAPLSLISDILLGRGGQAYLFSRYEQGMSRWNLGDPARPVLAEHLDYRSGGVMTGHQPMAALASLGSGQMILPIGLTGGGASARHMAADGSFGNRVVWQTGASLPNDLIALQDLGAGQLVGAGRNGEIRMFSLAMSGNRVSAQQGAVVQSGAALTAIELADFGASSGRARFVLAASSEGNFLVSYQISGAGQLQRIDQLGSIDSGIGFSEPQALAVVAQFDRQFVVMASAGSSSLTVFELSATGMLQAVDHVVDSRDSRFEAIKILEVLRIDERVFILAAGGDDGLALLTLLPDGRLLHLQSLADTLDLGLSAISAIGAIGTGQGGDILIASAKEPGLTRLLLEFRPGLILQGGAGALRGAGADDLLIADQRSTALMGEAGNDILFAVAPEGGRVELSGGAGADVFVIAASRGQVVILDYEPGRDRLDLTFLPMLRSKEQLVMTAQPRGMQMQFGDLLIDLRYSGGYAPDALALAQMFAQVELLPISRFHPNLSAVQPSGVVLNLGNRGGTALGGRGDDALTGGAGHDLLRGEDGDDTLSGGTGNDTIEGGAGNDLISVTSGANWLWGGAGDDTLHGGSGADVIYGGPGRNQLSGNGGADSLFGGDAGDLLDAGAGNDMIRAGAGDDVIHAGAGDDNIGGGGGHDLIYGLSGANTIWGGLGDDTLYGGSGADALYGGPGRNSLYGNDGADFLYGGDAGDLLDAGAGNDTIRAGAGRDVIYAGAGDDNIGGGAGDDVIYAISGANMIWGGLGNDTLHAGLGKDRLTGGDGADHFVFASAATIGIGLERDVIADFTPGRDRIDLSAVETRYNAQAGLIGQGQASFYYHSPGGLLIGDQNGDGRADWVIEMSLGLALSAQDFLL